MKRFVLQLTAILALSYLLAGCSTTKNNGACCMVESPAPDLGDFYLDAGQGKKALPAGLLEDARMHGSSTGKTSDGRTVTVAVTLEGTNYSVKITAKPDRDILHWSFAVKAADDEYFTGLMERVVDGIQKETWRPGLTNAMDLRGQSIDMILKPTLSVYAPFYISSRGYGLFVRGNWPGKFDFCKSDSHHVLVDFEGPSLEFKVYKSSSPVELVKAHALDAGPPIVPPRWTFTPWRWRDDNTQRKTYYDGTPVTGPFNSEFMEDVLLMHAYGIPNGVMWIDRPWGPGKNGYDDFKIDEKRLPHFAESVKWLDQLNAKMVLWIGPFFQGEMETNALKMGYCLPGQKETLNNYPMCDFTNPDAKKYWQDGVAKLLQMGVAGFKMDRAEEQIPESSLTDKVHDGRSIRENRNAYPPMYLKAAYDVAKQYRGDDFACMPRAAYTGSAPYGVFWGGDIGGTEYGLRAEIIGVQRAATMGYPVWGSDTCGYNEPLQETEVCGRWLAFSCFTPIMEVGPLKDLAFWHFHNPPRYDTDLIALWRFYARLHNRLADYTLTQAQVAHDTGLPIVRPLFLVEPQAKAAWTNWWTYEYGPDILVSPIWKKGQVTQRVYLPSGEQWRDAWTPKSIYQGGQTITVKAPLHKAPIFVRVGANVDLGDLNQEWKDAVAAANTRPNLRELDMELREWFDKTYGAK